MLIDAEFVIGSPVAERQGHIAANRRFAVAYEGPTENHSLANQTDISARKAIPA